MLVGDFNVWAEIADDADNVLLRTLMNAYGLTQLVKVPTHIEGHTLEHLYVNENQMQVKHEVVERFDISTDHFPNIVDIPIINTKTTKETITFRRTKDMDINSLKLELKEGLEQLLFSEENFGDVYKKYKTISQNVVDKFAPVITKTITKHVSAPWMDDEYKIAKRKRRKREKKWRKCKSVESRTSYVEQREKCAQMSVEKKKEYFSKIVEDAGNDQKTLFEVVTNLLDKKENRILPEHNDPKELANDFNHYYVTKVEDLRKSIPVETDEIVQMERFTGEKLSQFDLTNDEEIKDILKESGIKTSPEDPIPAKIIKSVVEELVPTLTKLVNKSLSEGSMDEVKLSVIDPLLKKIDLDAEVRKNYRPVNNNVFFSKLTERVVKRRLLSHMQTNRLLSDKQFAYKQFHSPETMMVGIVNDVLLGFEKNQATVMIFLDLSAAFDTIDIERMLKVLSEEIGITGSALEWFRSFLTGRKQKVRIKDVFSDCLEVLFGTVQGSVLGPILFNIYVRSLPKVFEKSGFGTTSFADDNNGQKTFSLQFQYNILKYDVPACVHEVTRWMNVNFLKINGDKTEILLLYPESLSEKVIIKGTFINDQCIRFSNEVKNSKSDN